MVEGMDEAPRTVISPCISTVFSGGRLRKRDSQMTVRRHPKTAEEVLQRGAQRSARKFARNEVIPSIGTLLREFVLFQSGLFRGFDPGPCDVRSLDGDPRSEPGTGFAHAESRTRGHGARDVACAE